MRSRVLLLAVALACVALAPTRLAASDLRLKVIAHPTRAGALDQAVVRAIYLKQRQFWGDGKPTIPINREAGSDVREAFSEKVFGQGSGRLAAYWNQRYYEAGEFPPATLASDEAVLRFVAGNPDAIGYVAADTDTDSVAVVLTLR